MIKFFRKIRQNLLNEGKTTKYFKYAIGEIVLVVIGILIALQINNWNNQRIANKQMNAFLFAIIEDLKSDVTQFDRRIIFLSTLAEQKKNILELSNFESIDTDSLFLTIRPRTSNYEINATTFSKIKSLGITQISKNDSLSEKIYNYYTAVSASLNDNMNWDIQGSTEASNYYYFGFNQFELNLKGYDLENSDEILNFQDESVRKANLVKLLSEPTGRNHYKLDYARKQIIAGRLGRFKDLATELISDIEKELNQQK